MINPTPATRDGNPVAGFAIVEYPSTFTSLKRMGRLVSQSIHTPFSACLA